MGISECKNSKIFRGLCPRMRTPLQLTRLHSLACTQTMKFGGFKFNHFKKALLPDCVSGNLRVQYLQNFPGMRPRTPLQLTRLHSLSCQTMNFGGFQFNHFKKTLLPDCVSGHLRVQKLQNFPGMRPRTPCNAAAHSATFLSLPNYEFRGISI